MDFHRSAVCTYGNDADLQHTVTIGDAEYGTMHYHAVTVTAGRITGEMQTSSATAESTPTWALQTESTGTGSSGSGVAEGTEESGSEARPTGGVDRVMRGGGLSIVMGGMAAVVAFMGAAF
jgi:hypothetical protein